MATDHPPLDPDEQHPTPDPAPDPVPDPATPDEPEVEPAPLLTLRDGLPPVIETAAELAELCRLVAAGSGPVALDAERASGYRYSSRAYLIQLRREGAGSWLIDPIAYDDLVPLQEAIGDAEWILHAATQDLPCLAELGLRPAALFDTELAGRLLGYPRVGLGTLTETVLGWRMKKEHSAVDWSTRPLPEPWLDYAALDVELLIELREALGAELAEQGKADWAAQEFEHLRDFTATPRVDAWRRTSGMHRVRGRRGLAAVKALWEERDRIAELRDVTPGRIVPDSAIVVAAQAMPTDRATLLAIRGFHGRGAERYAARWLSALTEAAQMPEADLPARSPRTEGPPMPRAWAERDPVAARRLALAREAMAALAEQHTMPVENLVTPDYLRRVLWTPPETREPGELLDAVAGQLGALGARGWQIALTAPLITEAILDADTAPAAPADPPADPPAEDGPARED